ncbi:MAG: hypothetical protein AAGI50_06570 [Pseudomonadota bacterium]
MIPSEVIRHALGALLRMAEAERDGERVYVGDRDGRLTRELVFVKGR